jgi:hypothetical protein
MMARSTTLQSKAGYIDARPPTAIAAKSTCNARPDHTFGSKATVWQSAGHFRSTPINRHSQMPTARLKGVPIKEVADLFQSTSARAMRALQPEPSGSRVGYLLERNAIRCHFLQRESNSGQWPDVLVHAKKIFRIILRLQLLEAPIVGSVCGGDWVARLIVT